MQAAVGHVNGANFQQEVVQASVPVVVDFWAPWCGPCRMVAPELDKAAAQLGARAKIVKVNVDENPALASLYGVMSIPTLLIFHHGSAIGRQVGFVPADKLVAAIAQYLAPV